MKAIDRVKALHSKNDAAPICDDCIFVRAKLSSRQESNFISRRLVSTSQLVRRKDSCSVCGGVKYVMFCGKDASGFVEARENRSHQKKTSLEPSLKTSTICGTKNLDKLLEIGFISIGHWQTSGGSPNLVQTDLHNASPALYAFVENGRVLYVGKTSQTLKKRLYFYGRPGISQRTNIRINTKLKTALAEGREIEMYGYNDVRPFKVGVFELNLAAALEDSIIKTLSPVWNSHGT